MFLRRRIVLDSVLLVVHGFHKSRFYWYLNGKLSPYHCVAELEVTSSE